MTFLLFCYQVYKGPGKTERFFRSFVLECIFVTQN
jgi:hypothetical protein